MIGLLLLFLLALILSAFFSTAEMGFVSANRLKLRELADKGHRGAQKTLEILQFPQHFLSAILIANNIANITATALFTYFMHRWFNLSNEFIVTALIAPILIIFCEMLPKDYARLRAQNFLLRFAFMLDILLKFLHLPVDIILRIIQLFLKLEPDGHKGIFVDQEEFRSLIEEGTKSGALDHHEKQLINTILDFERVDLDRVMIPLDKVAKVELTATVAQAKEVAKTMNARMILVYEEIPSIIVGMIYTFDLLFESDDQQGLRHFLRSPIFLPRTTSIEKAFLTLQEKRQSFAVVTDAYSEALGAVPIEKLFIL